MCECINIFLSKYDNFIQFIILLFLTRMYISAKPYCNIKFINIHKFKYYNLDQVYLLGENVDLSFEGLKSRRRLV